MSLLSYVELCDLVKYGVISPVKPECINASSIDVHLGDILWVEKERFDVNSMSAGPEWPVPLDLAKKPIFKHEEIDLKITKAYVMKPREFVLASTVEQFNLPNNVSAEFRLKSSGARCGLNNLFACHCDAGWTGSVLTLELHNVLRFHKLMLTPGMAIGQILFHYHYPVPKDKSYAVRGHYNYDTTTQGAKA
jgi:dCTP deaminase